jgi:CheY-like chemotaxis protein
LKTPSPGVCFELRRLRASALPLQGDEAMFENKPILIVEDECFVALDLATAVEDWQGQVVGPAATVVEALHLLEIERIAGAILDAELLDRDVTPVALALARQGIPFVIHSGTGVPVAIASAVPDVPVVMKPARTSLVLGCLLARIAFPAGDRVNHE